MLRLNTELRTLESYLIDPFPGQEGYFLLGHDYIREWNFAVVSQVSFLFGAVRLNSSLWTYPRERGDEGTGKNRPPSTGPLITSSKTIIEWMPPRQLHCSWAGCRLGIWSATDSSDKSVCCIHGTGPQSIPLHSTGRRCSSPSLPALQGTALCSPRQSLSQGRMKAVVQFSPEQMINWPSPDKPLETRKLPHFFLFKCLDPFCTSTV